MGLFWGFGSNEVAQKTRSLLVCLKKYQRAIKQSQAKSQNKSDVDLSHIKFPRVSICSVLCQIIAEVIRTAHCYSTFCSP